MVATPQRRARARADLPRCDDSRFGPTRCVPPCVSSRSSPVVVMVASARNIRAGLHVQIHQLSGSSFPPSRVWISEPPSGCSRSHVGSYGRGPDVHVARVPVPASGKMARSNAPDDEIGARNHRACDAADQRCPVGVTVDARRHARGESSARRTRSKARSGGRARSSLCRVTSSADGVLFWLLRSMRSIGERRAQRSPGRTHGRRKEYGQTSRR